MDLGDPQAATLLAELADASPDRLTEVYTHRSKLPMWRGHERWFETPFAYMALEIPDTAECRLVVFTEPISHTNHDPASK